MRTGQAGFPFTFLALLMMLATNEGLAGTVTITGNSSQAIAQFYGENVSYGFGTETDFASGASNGAAVVPVYGGSGHYSLPEGFEASGGVDALYLGNQIVLSGISDAAILTDEPTDGQAFGSGARVINFSLDAASPYWIEATAATYGYFGSLAEYSYADYGEATVEMLLKRVTSAGSTVIHGVSASIAGTNGSDPGMLYDEDTESASGTLQAGNYSVTIYSSATAGALSLTNNDAKSLSDWSAYGGFHLAVSDSLRQLPEPSFSLSAVAFAVLIARRAKRAF